MNLRYILFTILYIINIFMYLLVQKLYSYFTYTRYNVYKYLLVCLYIVEES